MMPSNHGSQASSHSEETKLCGITAAKEHGTENEEAIRHGDA